MTFSQSRLMKDSLHSSAGHHDLLERDGNQVRPGTPHRTIGQQSSAEQNQNGEAWIAYSVGSATKCKA
jgi:hypothetical protein